MTDVLTVPRWAFVSKRWSVDHAARDLFGHPRETCPCEPIRAEVTPENYERVTATVRGEPMIVVHRARITHGLGEAPYLLLHLEPYERGDLDGVPATDMTLVGQD